MEMTTGYRTGLGFTGGIAEFLELALATILIAAIRGLLETDSWLILCNNFLTYFVVFSCNAGDSYKYTYVL
jgi:hypothetical protein